MSQLSQKIVNAVLDGQRASVRQLAPSDSSSPAVASAARAILDCYDVYQARTPPARAQGSVDACLEQPPQDLELLQIVMFDAVWLALHRGDTLTASRLNDRLRQLRDTTDRPELRALYHIAASSICVAQSDFESALRLISEGLEPGVPVGGYIWRRLKLHHIDYSLRCGLIQTVDRDLADIQQFVDPANPEQFLTFTYLSVRRHSAVGDIDKAEAALHGLTAEHEQANPRLAMQARVLVLTDAGRFNEAHRLLDSANASALPPGYLDRARALVHLLSGNLNEARTCALNALREDPSPLNDHVSQTYLVWIDLSMKRTNEARKGLMRLDPSTHQSRFDFEWFRLLVQENDETAAARRLRRFLDRAVDGQLESNLRFAPEVSAHQLVRLQRLAHTLPEQPDGPVSAAAAAIRGQPPATPPDARLAQQLVGRSRVMIEVRHRVRRFAELDTPVLVGGETGTGKEVVARLLHELSPRTDEPFTAINCGGLTESLIESELFGHVKGAFTGATRDHRGLFLDTREGTIFLDEVNAMSPRLQASLLRVLENGEVRAVGGSKVARIRCRVVAAANESLEHAVREKGFRADLYYRLSRLTIDLPPLRDRIEDLEPLSKHFLQSVYGPMEVVLGQDLLEAFGKYDWPGNVRELKNEIEHIALMAGGRQVLSADLFRKAPRAAEPETGKARKRRVNGDDKSAALPANSLLAQLQRSRPLNLRNTQTRRRLLKEMFEQYGRLTRAEIIRVLDCAPNTATRDLRELEDEGTIRRVKTSAHLRTSYFERVEE